MGVRLQADPFDPGAELDRFLRDTGGAGAAVTFTGVVRSSREDPIVSMTLEHYPALAQRQLETLALDAIARFDLLAVDVIHRFGTLRPGDPIVQVMALAPHRHAAFEGANFVMDTLKTNAPFWKKERRPDGERWVEATHADAEASARWS